MALSYAGVTVELREILLKDKPTSMLQASAKGTVPVLVLPDNSVIDESAEVMMWALDQQDSDSWWQNDLANETIALVKENDFVFKKHLDHYKYADRHPEHPVIFYRTAAEKFLRTLEQRLARERFLMDAQLTFADVAIFPFIRQFAFVDKAWFDRAPYPKLQTWLQAFLESDLFLDVMKKLPTWCENPSYE